MNSQRAMIMALVGFIVLMTAYLMTQTPDAKGTVDNVPAPEATLVPDNGSPAYTMSSLRGKVVILDFWATWCGPCRMSIPELEKLHQKYKTQDVQVIGVSMDEPNTQSSIPMVKKELGITYAVALGAKAPEIVKHYGSTSLPTLYVIDKKGTIRRKDVGFDPQVGMTRVDDLVKQLLKE